MITFLTYISQVCRLRE